MIRKIIVSMAALVFTSSAASPPAVSCRVFAQSEQTFTPGIYAVLIRLSENCSMKDSARVRLESYIGGTYPRTGWITITRSHPFKRTGVPWYWRGSRLVGDKEFDFPIPGMEAP